MNYGDLDQIIQKCLNMTAILRKFNKKQISA